MEELDHNIQKYKYIKYQINLLRNELLNVKTAIGKLMDDIQKDSYKDDEGNMVEKRIHVRHKIDKDLLKKKLTELAYKEILIEKKFTELKIIKANAIKNLKNAK